jgi:4-alpha-glucanotransferase
MNTPAASTGNWAWRFEEGALHPDFAVQLAALVEMTDRDGCAPPELPSIPVSASSAEPTQTI